MSTRETGNFLSDFRSAWHELHALRGAPFQALVTFDEHTIFTGYGTAQKVVKRAALIGNLSHIAKKHAMCVLTDYHKQKKNRGEHLSSVRTGSTTSTMPLN
jgi:putative transcriptional regulator